MFVFFLCLVFLFGFCVFVFFWCFVLFLDERDSALDYVSVLHQFTFAATTATAFA